MLKFSVGLYAKLVSKIGRLSHVASGRGMMMRTAVARAPATRKWENKGGDLCQQHLELTKIATLTDFCTSRESHSISGSFVFEGNIEVKLEYL